MSRATVTHPEEDEQGHEEQGVDDGSFRAVGHELREEPAFADQPRPELGGDFPPGHGPSVGVAPHRGAVAAEEHRQIQSARPGHSRLRILDEGQLLGHPGLKAQNAGPPTQRGVPAEADGGGGDVDTLEHGRGRLRAPRLLARPRPLIGKPVEAFELALHHDRLARQEVGPCRDIRGDAPPRVREIGQHGQRRLGVEQPLSLDQLALDPAGHGGEPGLDVRELRADGQPLVERLEGGHDLLRPRGDLRHGNGRRRWRLLLRPGWLDEDRNDETPGKHGGDHRRTGV